MKNGLTHHFANPGKMVYKRITPPPLSHRVYWGGIFVCSRVCVWIYYGCGNRPRSSGYTYRREAGYARIFV